MLLSSQQNEALKVLLGALLDCDESGAFLATLQHIAERKAKTAARNVIDGYEAALRWQSIAEACDRLIDALEAADPTQIVGNRPLSA